MDTTEQEANVVVDPQEPGEPEEGLREHHRVTETFLLGASLWPVQTGARMSSRLLLFAPAGNACFNDAQRIGVRQPT